MRISETMARINIGTIIITIQVGMLTLGLAEAITMDKIKARTTIAKAMATIGANQITIVEEDASCSVFFQYHFINDEQLKIQRKDFYSRIFCFIFSS